MIVTNFLKTGAVSFLPFFLLISAGEGGEYCGMAKWGEM